MRAILAIAALALLTAPAAHAADRLRLQLAAEPTAAHAGYVVARERGFYAAEGLQVELLPGQSDSPPDAALARGTADVAVMGLPHALAARGAGLPVVNVAQPFGAGSLGLACLRAAGIEGPASDLSGQTIAVDPTGDDLVLRAWLARRRIATDGGATGVTLIARGDGLAQLESGRATCVAVHAADPTPTGPIVRFRLADGGGDLPDNGIYVLAPTLNDPAARDRLERFVRASIRGWREAAAQPDATATLLATLDGGRVTDQRQRLDAVLPLLGSGAMGPETVAQAGATLGIATDAGAWTTAITDAALR